MTGDRASAAVPVKELRKEKDPGTDPVLVWPYLLQVEAVAALVFLVVLSVASVLFDAPLLDQANPELTPNPSKAPWYFLGLQELLLHMHPSLAGVILPAVTLLGLAAIPYIDTRKKGTGIWFYSKDGVAITVFSWLYTIVFELALILLDEYLPAGEPGAHGITKAVEFLVSRYTTASYMGMTVGSIIGTIVIPVFLTLFIPALLVVIVRRRWRADTREVMIALYSFFAASFILLTVIGTGFRGESMRLTWPWNLAPPHQ